MRVKSTFLTAAALLSAFAVPVLGADSPAQVKKAIQSAMTRYVDAWKKLDPKLARKVFAETSTLDYVSTDVGTGQQHSRAQILAEYEKQMKAIPKLYRYEASVSDLKLQGNKAFAVLKYYVSGAIPDPEGKTHKMEVWQTSKSTWIKTDSVWKIRTSATKVDKTLLDGKPLVNEKPAAAKTKKGSGKG